MLGESYQGGLARQRGSDGGHASHSSHNASAPAAACTALTRSVFGPWGAGFQPETDPEVKASAFQHLPLKLTHAIPLGAKPQQP